MTETAYPAPKAGSNSRKSESEKIQAQAPPRRRSLHA
jgi:hypothetical protein